MNRFKTDSRFKASTLMSPAACGYAVYWSIWHLQVNRLPSHNWLHASKSLRRPLMRTLDDLERHGYVLLAPSGRGYVPGAASTHLALVTL